MGVSVNWLKKYVDFDWPADELAHRLTMAGVAVEKLESLDDAEIIELDLTPNRGDCLGLINLAREVAALNGSKVKVPPVHLQENSENINDYIKVHIAAPQLCKRYSARVIKNCHIGQSPAWMQLALISSGIRPVNNLVDITNYVMLECNQPLHAFDYDLLPNNKEILVRQAAADEKVITLDGIERILNEQMLLITDGERPIALAGIMGGENTEIRSTTTNVLLESANFNFINIRNTSRALSLRSDSSVRFEKGVDINGARYALDRAARLMQSIAGGEVVGGVADNYPEKMEAVVIELRPRRVNEILGSSLTAQAISEYLTRLNFTVNKKKINKVRGYFQVTVPTYRPDVQIEEDLIEEVARLHGYENIPAHLPEGMSLAGGLDDYQQFKYQVKELMAQQLHEVINYSFVNPVVCDQMMWRTDSKLRNMVAIANPLSEDYSVMRTSLIPSLLKNVSNNAARQINNLGFFEMGTVFHPDDEILPVELLKLSAIVYGNRESNWLPSKTEMDFFYLKGLVEGLFRRVGLKSYTFEPCEAEGFHTGRTAVIRSGIQKLGVIGEIHPEVQENFGLKSRVCAFELDMSWVFRQCQPKSLTEEITKYPVVERDIAVIVPLTVSAGELIDLVQKVDPLLIKEVTLFDVYVGNQVPAGKKSMALRIKLWSRNKTLTDLEVKTVMDNVMNSIKNQLKATLR